MLPLSGETSGLPGSVTPVTPKAACAASTRGQDILRSPESGLSIAAAADESYDEWHRDGIKEGMDAGVRKRAHGFRR